MAQRPPPVHPGDVLQLAAARLVVDLALPEDLPDVAVEALEAGWDAPSLRRLAGVVPAAAVDSRPLFEKALAELGRAMPTRREATVCVARDIAQRILSGEVSPRAGVRALWTLGLDGDVPELGAFVYCDDEWELLGVPACSEAVRADARDFLDAYPLPSDGSSPSGSGGTR